MGTGKPTVWNVAEMPAGNAIKHALQQLHLPLVVTMPLLAKGELVGIINLATPTPREISVEELALLGAIGQQIGIAVENARLYDQAEQSAALAERTRLARELHDSVTQSLYSVTLYAEAAAILLESGNQSEAASHLRELRDTAQEALREMRLLIFELRPLALEKSGLVAALQARLDAVESRGGTKTDFRVDGEEHLPLGVQQELYHIAQEALNNILKHAKASRVSVHLSFGEQQTCLEIQDDGVGFDVAHLNAGGLGLPGIHERAQKIGGHLDIASAPGKGTRIKIMVPLVMGRK
jgi:signal transduction histidine kinase